MPIKPQEPGRSNPEVAERDPVLESISRIEKMMKAIVLEVSITLIRSFTIKGQTFADAQRIATEIFKAFVASPCGQTKEGWVDFFVKEVEANEVEVSSGTMERLRVKLLRIQEKHDLALLFNMMGRFETLKADDEKGKERLPRETRERILLLLYDLGHSHI
jgi:hypothetical protein